MGTRKKYAGHPPAAVPHDTGLLVPPRVLRFLNSLPVGGDVVEWLLEFREALRQFLGDVDRISIRVNADKPIRLSKKGQWAMNINQIIYIENETQKKYLPNSEILWGEGASIAMGESARLLEEMRRLNLPLQDYQQPHCYDYYWPLPLTLGGVILFRRRGASPISAQTLDLVERLEPFFVFLLTSLRTRYFYHHPGAAIFNWSILSLYDELKLTGREFEVLILRLYGLTFKQIAAELFLSHATVRKHLQSLLRKAKARNVIEMFTRRFLQGADEVLAAGKGGIPEISGPDTRGSGDIYLW